MISKYSTFEPRKGYLFIYLFMYFVGMRMFGRGTLCVCVNQRSTLGIFLNHFPQ